MSDQMSHSREAEPGLALSAGYGIAVHSWCAPRSRPGTDKGAAVAAAPVEVVIGGPDGSGTWPAPASCAQAIALLSSDRVSERALLAALPRHCENEGRLALCCILEMLARIGGLRRVTVGRNASWYEVEPLGDYYRFEFCPQLARGHSLRLLRFCLLRPERGKMVLEAPITHARVWLFEPSASAAIAALADGRSVGDIADTDSNGSDATNLEALLSVLVAEGFATASASAGEVAETESLQHWEFHDLWFHSRSRRGRTGNIVGASFRFRDKSKPLPATKAAMSSAPIVLSRPDVQSLARTDMSVTSALELRASVREPTLHTITLVELGHFLFRSARVRHGGIYHGVELTNRPYPSGGASYELEIYPVVDRCAGLLSGVYHYDPLLHALHPLVPANAASERLLQIAHAASGYLVRPQILLIITARFGRVSWKYESIAYATILKNVGALYQTMYLVATAMRLAPCAVGAGDSDLFCSILQNDYYEESAVGEFMLSAKANG
jgi:SagB-type dehydrogenase family enzyme